MMGEWFVSDNPAPQAIPILTTSSANPCLIIIIHRANETGALAHYPGDFDPDKFLVGVGKMVKSFTSPGNVDTILIAGGGGCTEEERASTISKVRVAYNTAKVIWPLPDEKKDKEPYAAAFYFPTLNKVALFRDDEEVETPGGTCGRSLTRFTKLG
jgi:hypothetical protein